MRILDESTEFSLSKLTVFLTKAEAGQLRDAVDALLQRGGRGHEHVDSEDFTKEITVAVYDVDDISQFCERAQHLILHDE